MSSPQPERLHVAPTPRITVSSHHASSSSPPRDERHPNAWLIATTATAATTTTTTTNGGVGAGESNRHHPTANKSGGDASMAHKDHSSNSISSRLPQPRPEHHVWSIATPPRQKTKSALRHRHQPPTEMIPFGDDPEVHYDVAGYRSESGAVSFYRTSIHKKDPQNIVLSHGRVSGRVADFKRAPAANSAHIVTANDGQESGDEEPLAFASPLLVRYRHTSGGANVFPSAQTQGTVTMPVAAAALPSSALPMPPFSSKSPNGVRVSSASPAVSAEGRRPRWNMSPRPTALAAHQGIPNNSGIGAVHTRSLSNTSVGSRHTAASFAMAPTEQNSNFLGHRPVRAFPGQQHSSAVSLGLSSDISAGSPDRSQLAPPPPPLRSTNSHVHGHDCREARCTHSRSDIMEVIVAKSQVRALEAQLLHEEIRREQLSSALAAERERSSQLWETLQRYETNAIAINDSKQLHSDVQGVTDHRASYWQQLAQQRLQEVERLNDEIHAQEENFANERSQALATVASLRSLEEQLDLAHKELHSSSVERQLLRKELHAFTSSLARQEPAQATTDELGLHDAIKALESRIAQLQEDRQADERLRKELLRALTDKERQIAAISARSPTSAPIQQAACPEA